MMRMTRVIFCILLSTIVTLPILGGMIDCRPVSAVQSTSYSFNEVSISSLSVNIYDSTNYQVGRVTPGQSSWIQSGYPRLEFAVSQPFLCDEDGEQVNKSFYSTNDNLIAVKSVGNKTYHYRRFFYASDFMVRTKVYLDPVIYLPMQYKQFLGVTSASISAVGETNNGWSPIDSQHSLIVIEEHAPAASWWSTGLDTLYADRSAGNAPVQGRQYQLPISGSLPSTVYPRGDYVSSWRDGFRGQFGTYGETPSGVASMDYPSIYSQYGGQRLIVEPIMTVDLRPFVDGDFSIQLTDGIQTFVLQDKTIGIYGTTVIRQPLYGLIGNDLNESFYEQQWAQEIATLGAAGQSSTEQSMTNPSQTTISASAPDGTTVDVPIAFSQPVKTTDPFMVSGLSYGTSLPMFYNQVQRPDIQFRSDLSLAKDVPSTVDIKPRFDIQPMFSKWEMDISATPRYLGYKNPSTDPYGNLYFADTADVHHDLPRESIRLVNRLRVDNTFVVQRFRYEVITGSEYGSTWVPFSSGVGLNVSNDYGINDVFIRQPPEPYVPPTTVSTVVSDNSVMIIVVAIIIVGIAIIAVVLFVSRKRTPVKTVKK